MKKQGDTPKPSPKQPVAPPVTPPVVAQIAPPTVTGSINPPNPPKAARPLSQMPCLLVFTGKQCSRSPCPYSHDKSNADLTAIATRITASRDAKKAAKQSN